MKLLQTNLYDPEPKKEDFEVFDHLPHGGAYKKLEGRRKYNDEMYQEAHSAWKRRQVKPNPTDYKLKNESTQDWFGSDRCEKYKFDLTYYEQHRLKYEGFEYLVTLGGFHLFQLPDELVRIWMYPNDNNSLSIVGNPKGKRFELTIPFIHTTTFNQICKENGIKIKEI
jgi:hypothetical protein